MFLGHFAVALAAKRAAPTTSLGALVLGAQFADLLWPVLLLLGVEQVRIVPGLLAASPFDFVAYPISHSLVMQLGWGCLLGLGYFLVRRSFRDAVVVGALVPTHWLLDLVAHRPDLPLVPGGARFGLGLWHSVPLTLAVELALFAAGAAVYLRMTRSLDRTGRWAIGSLLAFLAMMMLAALLGPPPPSVTALAWSGIALWLLVAWAAWADRHRTPYV
jgi:hypothetical protein